MGNEADFPKIIQLIIGNYGYNTKGKVMLAIVSVQVIF